MLAAAAGGATYGFLNSTAEVAKSGELNTESALHVADETLKGSFISTMSTATFMGEMAFMEPVAMPAVAKLFVAGSGAGVTSTFVDATIEGRKVTDKEILMSGLKGGFDTLIVSEVASAYEYRSYAKWQKTAPSVKAVTERANNTIKSETCEGGSKTGADRAAQYSGSWQSGSVKDAINRFAPDATPTYTDSGKIIFRNETTGIEVVYDRNGNYYRIIDTNLSGRRTALDIDGNIVPNNVQTERGSMRGMTQSEFNAITHFNNTDLDFDK